MEVSTIRSEQASDVPAIRDVHVSAFPTSTEAELVDQLRENGSLAISLVALHNDRLIGHIAFSPVSLENGPAECEGVGLAPVAVIPEQQNRGIGGQLIEAGLDACRAAGFGYVVVLGEPLYYHRFGFAPASLFSLDNEYEAADEFMVAELIPGCLADCHGLVRYSPEFQTFT